MVLGVQQQSISVDAALAAILAASTALSAERVSLLEACERVLAEDIVARSALPPFANAAMDGFACRYDDLAAVTESRPARLRVIGEAAAGRGFGGEVFPGTAVRIMTGAPIPASADVVVRFEDTDDTLPGAVLIRVRPQQPGQHIRPLGEDVPAGQLVLQAGAVLRPQEIGLLAALGVTEVAVVRRPRVAIIATGDELRPVDAPLEPGTIHNSNESMLAALVLRYGGLPLCMGIAKDEPAALTATIAAALAREPDLLLTSAGVSVGDYDMVKDVLCQLGSMTLWQVGIKPGKPLAFGTIDGIPLIGLPGNPGAALIAAEVFLRPALLQLSGKTNLAKPALTVILDEDVAGCGRRHYLRARVYRDGASYRVTTRGPSGQGAGMLSALCWANALLVVPEQSTSCQAGSLATALLLDGPEGVTMTVPEPSWPAKS